MGCQCGDTSILHVTQENILIQIVDDDDDQPCTLGKTGREIITRLFGAAFPLIRYDQGDWAELQ
jgi:phenylacetate-CoA ligase